MSVSRVAGIVALCTVALVACGDDEPSSPGPSGPTVNASASNVFSPSPLDITVGQTVTWVFGPVDHNVLFDDVTGAPADIPITRNASVARTFNDVGTFTYLCSLHAGMTGTVRVAAGS